MMRGAVLRLMNRYGLAVAGQVLFRWSSQAASRVRTGPASGMSRSPRVRRPSTMSVSFSPRSCLLVRAWNPTRATASATAGFGESSSRRTRAVSSGSGMLV